MELENFLLHKNRQKPNVFKISYWAGDVTSAVNLKIGSW